MAPRYKELKRDGEPLWFKDAILYELHVRAFKDSDGDGMGDFKGLTETLDYLSDLGVTALWILPFCPSPWKDDGYDIADFTAIHQAYGNMRDFKAFLREAHRRGLRVISELVLNHTSDQHPWFQKARQTKRGNRWRDFYVWSDTPDRYRETRIIFKDFEQSNWTWDPVARAYYWHRFYSHQPDLNYDNPLVRKAVFRVLDFWFDLGVDGLRLDAVPYLFEREGTNCENLPETYAFLKELRAHVDRRFNDRMLLAEANQWPEDAVAYFGDGDACHMAFHFPLMPRLFMALRMEDRFPVIDILEQTPTIPESCQWALFLRNHDELTLEMVTDEERDYMYRVYGHDPQMRINLGIRRRLAPLLGNHRRRIELMTGLLLSLPGTPAIYYGDEIGMGDNVYLGDRNGVRTPMQWSADRNAGFSRANPQRLYLPVIIDPEYHYEAINVEAQQNNTHSLLWWTKRLFAMRKRFRAFGRGSIEFLNPDNRKVLAYLRRYENECILVVANLSRFVQYVDLDLRGFNGIAPIELFGGTEFPPIEETPYFLTLGPHSFYWFALEARRPAIETIAVRTSASDLPVLAIAGSWENVLEGKAKSQLEKTLPDYLYRCRWFGGKARRIKSTRVYEILPTNNGPSPSFIMMLEVGYVEGDAETYVIPLTFVTGDQADAISSDHPHALIARLRLDEMDAQGLLVDATVEKGFCSILLYALSRRRRLKGREGELLTAPTKTSRELRKVEDTSLHPSVLHAEQSNTSVVYGGRFILKLFRRPEAGINPDLEIGRFLTEREFGSIPHVVGSMEYVRGRQEPMTLAILQSFIPNEGDAWAYTFDVLNHFFEEALTRDDGLERFVVPQGSLLELTVDDPPTEISEMIGPYLESARLLGQRTAELHVLLASDSEEPNFAPEPFSKLYQRSLYQAMRSLTGNTFQLLRQRHQDLPEPLSTAASEVLQQKDRILKHFQAITERKITAMRIRCHGDYHLGQVLHTGKDFVIIDFEGEPARTISERRIKRSPLRDVAGMLRSFHYAAYSALFTLEDRGLLHSEHSQNLEAWARFWQTWVCAVFLRSYLHIADQGDFLPKTRDELKVLLEVYVLEKAIYELAYELNNRPEWVKIPLQGIREILSRN